MGFELLGILRGYTGSEKERWFLGSRSFWTKPCWTWSEKIIAFFHDQQGQAAIPFFPIAVGVCLPKSRSGDTRLSFQGSWIGLLLKCCRISFCDFPALKGSSDLTTGRTLRLYQAFISALSKPVTVTDRSVTSDRRISIQDHLG